jgi:hypothetical protein
MGQQCGLPAARTTKQEVLGAGIVDQFTHTGGADWPMQLVRWLL